MRPFKIGELTKLSGCTVKAIRDLKRLAFIRRVKLMGLPLEKIKDLVVHLNEEECACPKIRPHLEQLIREQLNEIATTVGQFALLKKDLEKRLVGHLHAQ